MYSAFHYSFSTDAIKHLHHQCTNATGSSNLLREGPTKKSKKSSTNTGYHHPLTNPEARTIITHKKNKQKI
jgi:hypothetical protein